jgi:hypothetical protein
MVSTVELPIRALGMPSAPAIERRASVLLGSRSSVILGEHPVLGAYLARGGGRP